jgi:4-hydroxy-tetrahydrodipicolinate reductase
VRLALFGHGRMGRALEAVARGTGHEIGAVITSGNAGHAGRLLAGHDAAIDFSVPAAVLEHVAACADAGVPLVEGTTGWQAQEAAVRALVEARGAALVFGPNFSLGANLFCRLVAAAADLVARLDGYDPFIEEAHHAAKRDAPSGTALALRELVRRGFGGREVPIASTRAGHIPGTHRVGFDSSGDQIVLEHVARNRDGFAAGALLAARWIAGRRGVYTFADVLDAVLAANRPQERNRV